MTDVKTVYMAISKYHKMMESCCLNVTVNYYFTFIFLVSLKGLLGTITNDSQNVLFSFCIFLQLPITSGSAYGSFVLLVKCSVLQTFFSALFNYTPYLLTLLQTSQ